MKNLFRVAFLTAIATTIFAGMMCVSAFAAETVTGYGFYDVGTISNVSIAVKKGSTSVTPIQADVDSAKSGTETFYLNSDRMTVTYNGTVAAGDNFTVMLVEGSSLPTVSTKVYYIKQLKATAAGPLTFDVYPTLPLESKNMSLFITSDRSGFTTLTTSVGYAKNGTYNTSASSYKLGDVNEDGNINAQDASKVIQYSTNPIVFPLTDNQKLAADVNLKSGVTSSDATGIIQYSTSRISSFTEIQG